MADNVKPLKDKLQIYLITYNRAKCLKYTLKQIFAPKLSSRKLEDGTMVSATLEDMYPFLDREEFEGNMISD